MAGKGGGLVSHGAELMAAYFLVYALAHAAGAWLPKNLAEWQQRWTSRYQVPDATFSDERSGASRTMSSGRWSTPIPAPLT